MGGKGSGRKKGSKNHCKVKGLDSWGKYSHGTHQPVAATIFKLFHNNTSTSQPESIQPDMCDVDNSESLSPGLHCIAILQLCPAHVNISKSLSITHILASVPSSYPLNCPHRLLVATCEPTTVLTVVHTFSSGNCASHNSLTASEAAPIYDAYGHLVSGNYHDLALDIFKQGGLTSVHSPRTSDRVARDVNRSRSHSPPTPRSRSPSASDTSSQVSQLAVDSLSRAFQQALCDDEAAPGLQPLSQFDSFPPPLSPLASSPGTTDGERAMAANYGLYTVCVEAGLPTATFLHLPSYTYLPTATFLQLPSYLPCAQVAI